MAHPCGSWVGNGEAGIIRASHEACQSKALLAMQGWRPVIRGAPRPQKPAAHPVHTLPKSQADAAGASPSTVAIERSTSRVAPGRASRAMASAIRTRNRGAVESSTMTLAR